MQALRAPAGYPQYPSPAVVAGPSRAAGSYAVPIGYIPTDVTRREKAKYKTKLDSSSSLTVEASLEKCRPSTLQFISILQLPPGEPLLMATSTAKQTKIEKMNLVAARNETNPRTARVLIGPKEIGLVD